MTTVVGVIGSEEIQNLDLFKSFESRVLDGVHLKVGNVHGTEVVFTLRAGTEQPTIPSFIDYVRVMKALDSMGCTHVISTAMVGSLRPALPVGHQTMLTQFLDFTKQRQFTYYSKGQADFQFADMTDPFCLCLNDRVLAAARSLNLTVSDSACYVGVEGPRFESRAEVAMYGLLGGDVIGGTILPEVVIAREAGKCYSTFAGVVNLGAGLGKPVLDADDFRRYRTQHSATFGRVLERTLKDWSGQGSRSCSCDLAHGGQL